MAAPFLSIVVPAYNEEAGIGQCLARWTACLDGRDLDWELLVVDDGSSDGTVAIVSLLARADARIRVVAAPHAGKGGAVRTGMCAARGAWRFMADADLSMPPENIDRFLALVQADPSVAIAIGSREAPGARRVGEPWRRHVIGRVFNRVVQLVAVPGVRDTQCGYKLFSAAAAERLFPHGRLDGFAFDVELLFLARRAGMAVREVGIEWYCRLDSRVSAMRGAAAFADILRVRWNAWSGTYDGVVPAGAPLRSASDNP